MPRFLQTLIADLRGHPPGWVVDELREAIADTRADILDHQEFERRLRAARRRRM